MLKWLRGERASKEAEAFGTTAALAGQDIAWRKGTTLPIPDWTEQRWPDTGAADTLHAHANALAATWLDAVGGALAQPHHRAESDHFMLLSTLAPRTARVLLDYLERSRKRVLATLPRIAQDSGHGKTVAIVFADEESYYRYVSNYTRASAEPEAFSGGMFIDAGYGHFVFVQGPFETMEPVVVHELTHCLLRHLDIPAWLNEGLAVNVEHRFTPSRQRYRANEREYLFSRFWDASTIQEFWSGKSFLRADDGQPLSYELAKLLVQLLDKDHDVLVRYCAEAHRDDGGEQAAVAVLGSGLQELAAIVLGPGPWQPQAGEWLAGTEQGQF